MLLLEKGDFLFSFDLKSGYHHVDIAEVHHKYLGFSWCQKWFVFTVLPFGLCTACYLFTKLLRPLVRYWRAQGLRVIIYLDDGLGAERGSEKADVASIMVQDTLRKAGFVPHPVKCRWKPDQRLSWLGFVIDTALGQIEAPASKLDALRSMIRRVTASPMVKAKQLASILGKSFPWGSPLVQLVDL